MIVVYLKMKLLKIGLINRLPKRYLWNFLTIVWNRVDHSRIKEVGPDRACAEWLLRNGASVKWENDKDFLKDYNLLPPEQVRRHIVAVEAFEASISSIGFPYFKGCSRVGSVSLDKCPYIDDEALRCLHYLEASLQHLSVSRCGGVAEPGILSLAQLGKLKTLKVHDLPYVKRGNECLTKLKASLPSCEVQFSLIQMEP